MLRQQDHQKFFAFPLAAWNGAPGFGGARDFHAKCVKIYRLDVGARGVSGGFQPKLLVAPSVLTYLQRLLLSNCIRHRRYENEAGSIGRTLFSAHERGHSVFGRRESAVQSFVGGCSNEKCWQSETADATGKFLG